MPNWCSNTMRLEGEPELVARAVASLKIANDDDADQRVLDFSTVIPYPQQFVDLDKRAHEFNVRAAEITKKKGKGWKARYQALRAEFGVRDDQPFIKDGYNSGGYEWCIANWGTKWNAAQVSLDYAEGERIAHYYFDTAWSPPTPVCEALARKFPGLQVEIEYVEEGMGFASEESFFFSEDGGLTSILTGRPDLLIPDEEPETVDGLIVLEPPAPGSVRASAPSLPMPALPARTDLLEIDTPDK